MEEGPPSGNERLVLLFFWVLVCFSVMIMARHGLSFRLWHLIFQILVTSLVDFTVSRESEVCRNSIPLFEHPALSFRFLCLFVVFLLILSSHVCHLVFFLITSLVDIIISRESEACRNFIPLFEHPALFRFLRLFDGFFCTISFNMHVSSRSSYLSSLLWSTSC